MYIPGYSGVISRINETIAGTFAKNSRDSHYLVYKGCKPAMEAPTLPSPDSFYARKPNPRIKTNAANHSNFTFGDERDWGFETINESQFRIPTKIPPRHASIMPPGDVAGERCSRAALDSAYNASFLKIGVAGVKRLELAIRSKIDQRTAGGPMALRKAFKFFDTDGSGDIDPDEFYAAMHAFGLEFTEDQVLALFGYYDIDRDGALSYYEFIEKVLESGFGLDTGPKKEPVMVQLAAVVDDVKDVQMKTIMRREDLSEKLCQTIFDKYDANKSGEIDIRELENLTRALGLSMSREALNNSMFELDSNKNGAISFEEFWTWWQVMAVSSGNASAPKTGGGGRGRNPSGRPSSQQSSRSGRGSQFGGSLSRPGSRASGEGMAGLKGAILGELDSEYNKLMSGTTKGRWLTNADRGGSRAASAMSRPSRPCTRNSQRSVAGQDYSPPPLLNRPPRLHGLQARSMSRPQTAPTDMFVPGYVRVPGTPAVPKGVSTGYVL